MSKPQVQNGYTLLEMLVTVSILAIFAAVAAPAWYTWLASTKADTIIYRLVGAINLARSTAIKQRITVTLCPRTDDMHCGDNWSQGWLVFLDHKGNGIREASDTIIRIDPKLPTGSSLTWRAFPSDLYLRISPCGYMLEQNGTFIYQSMQHQKTYIRKIIVSKTGRVRVET